MSPEPNSKDPSEQDLGRLLRGLPLRRAPTSLNERVFMLVQQREAHAGSRGKFAQWPAIQRALYLAACGAIVGVTALDGSWALAVRGVLTLGAPVLSWAHASGQVLVSLSAALELILRIIPAEGVYGAAALCILLYGALFGLGATAYRVLYLPTSSSDLP